MSTHYYHREIDGLRAISVIVILLFHLKVPQFGGGFIGVDVFFVVSGFLISQMILANLQAGTFSFRDFYARRVARIIPALAVTVLLTLLAASYVLHPDELMDTAWQSIAALFSVSNLYFWSVASYWAPDAETFLLLHTWSLGVEEQFYLFYPLLLYITHRYLGMRGVIGVLLLLLVGGAVANEWVFTFDRSGAFYLTPLRFYEFAVGGLGAIVFSRLDVLRASPWLSGIATLSGIAMIMYGALTFHPMFHVLPGYITLIPAGGALLIILAGASAPARVLLSNPVAAWLGKTSYSLYLVHWPIIVLYRHHFGGQLSWQEQAGLAVVIFIAAELLCRGVERRFRLSGSGEATAFGWPARSALLATAALVAVTTLGSGAALLGKGWPGRFGEAAQPLLAIDKRQEYQQRRNHFKETCVPRGRPLCGRRDPDRTNILLLGDSRVLDIYIALQTAYPDAAIQASFVMGCVAVFDKRMSFSIFAPDCAKRNRARLQAALDAPPEDIIFLANDLDPLRSAAILETVQQLRAAGKTVYLIGQTKFLHDRHRDPVALAIDSARFPGADRYLHRFLEDPPFALDGEYADRVNATGATYISTRPLFYDGDYHFDDRASGRLLTYDGVHLNDFGARKFGEYLREHYPLSR